MKKYIEFWERHSLEKTFYTRVRNENGDPDMEWEICWNGDKQESRPWGLRRIDDSQWHYYTLEQIYEVLQFQKLDIRMFVDEIMSQIKSKVVFAQLILTEAKSLFGGQFVNESMAEFEAFSDVLRQEVADILSSPSSSCQTKPQSSKTPNLKLVPN